MASEISDYLSLTREIVTGLISSAIIITALCFLWHTYTGSGAIMSGDQLAAYNRQKDVLALALGLLGTVTGYYLGRVPAERTADAAQAEAKASKLRETEMRNRTKVNLESIDRVVENIRTGSRDRDTGSQEIRSAIERARGDLYRSDHDALA